jgi:methylated-DNA-protein-cysteine methyltransferase-like protein
VAISTDVIFARIRRVPEGFVTTYGDVSPGAPRQTGRALSDCPPDVPWWRVVRSDGSLAKGEDQRRRLQEEDIPFHRGRVALEQVRIDPEAIY